MHQRWSLSLPRQLACQRSSAGVSLSDANIIIKMSKINVYLGEHLERFRVYEELKQSLQSIHLASRFMHRFY